MNKINRTSNSHPLLPGRGFYRSPLSPPSFKFCFKKFFCEPEIENFASIRHGSLEDLQKIK